MPLISVIIPTYNRAHILSQAIKSVLEQTFEDWELIVVDDGSNDITKKVITPYLKDGRISYYYQDNKGVSAARNFGASLAQGPFFVFLDSDDSVSNNWLMDFVKVINKDKVVELVFCGIKVVREEGEKSEKPSSRIKRKGMGWGIPITGSFLLNREVFLKVGGYDERLKFSENTELMIRLNKQKPRTEYTDQINLFYNQSETGGNGNISNKVEAIQYILEKHQGFFDIYSKDKLNLIQTLVVAQLKLKKFTSSRKGFVSSLLINPLNLKIYFRFLISFFPFLSQKVYG